MRLESYSKAECRVTSRVSSVDCRLDVYWMSVCQRGLGMYLTIFMYTDVANRTRHEALGLASLYSESGSGAVTQPTIGFSPTHPPRVHHHTALHC